MSGIWEAKVLPYLTAKAGALPEVMALARSNPEEAGRKYGSFTDGRTTELRYLYVIGPDGKIAYTAKAFKPMVEASYAELGDAVKKTAGFK